MALDPDFVALFRCPRCRGRLEARKAPHGLACTACALLYAVQDDLPNFLVEEALPLSDREPAASGSAG
jgi:uncharacterized protein YbaR (Trm112 family)